MAIIKCKNCGKEISDMATSCPECGTPVEKTITNENDSSDKTIDETTSIADPTGKSKKSKKKIIIPIISVLLIIGLVVCYIFVINPMMKYSNASKLFNEGKYSDAQIIYKELGTYKNSSEMVTECDYASAKALLDQGKYDEAKQAFDKISSYKDSASMSNECIYQKATSIFNEGNYEEAKDIFDSISDYKDAAEQSKGCTYQIALDLYNNEKYKEAIEKFVVIMDYADTKKYVYKLFDDYGGTAYMNECANGLNHLNSYLQSQSKSLLDFIYEHYWDGGSWSPDLYHKELKAMQECSTNLTIMESDFMKIFPASVIESSNDESLKTVYNKYTVVKNDVHKIISTSYAMDYIGNLINGIDNSSQLLTMEQHVKDYTDYYNSIEK